MQLRTKKSTKRYYFCSFTARCRDFVRRKNCMDIYFVLYWWRWWWQCWFCCCCVDQLVICWCWCWWLIMMRVARGWLFFWLNFNITIKITWTCFTGNNINLNSFFIRFIWLIYSFTFFWLIFAFIYKYKYIYLNKKRTFKNQCNTISYNFLSLALGFNY